MFDVFTEEIEILIKDGISNLYWYRKDLYKAWLRSEVDTTIAKKIYNTKDDEGNHLTKRRQMDLLYEHLRNADFNRRLKISRNFVRLLVEHKQFTPQDPNHRIEKAERCALRLKEIIREQSKEKEEKDFIRLRTNKARKESYHDQLLKLQEEFRRCNELNPQGKGYALEKLFTKLMQISDISIQEPFKIVGEQIDGGIKYDGHYYLIELKWLSGKAGTEDIGSFYYKVDGKLDSRGIFISMNGFTDGVLKGLQKGKEIKIMLLDGVHLSNVIFGSHTFNELLDHCISYAAYKAELYCPHAIKK